MVLEALRRIGLPALEAHTQPETKTLVNFETIFYTRAAGVHADDHLVDQQVDVEARPSSFTWHHGDGTTATTTSPGAPYPAKDIVYEYSGAHVTVDNERRRRNGSSSAWRAVPGRASRRPSPSPARRPPWRIR